MVTVKFLKNAIQACCAMLLGATFFFLIIGVFGFSSAITGLVIFIATAFWIIRGAVKKGGADYEA
jgi:hypothetical protein